VFRSIPFLSSMIPIKNEREIDAMRTACRVAAEVLGKLENLITPGMTTRDIDDACGQYIAEAGAKSAFLGYRKFPGQLCISVNEEVVHGIGGAAYDPITDHVVRCLVGSDPPRHAVVTGTLRLPLEDVHPLLAAADPALALHAARGTLRDLRYHPERHLPGEGDLPAAVHELLVAKRCWVETVPTPALARRRCREIRAANERMAFHLAGRRQDLLARVGPLAAAIRARKVLDSRDHPWCFFPETTLRRFLLLETRGDSSYPSAH